jgi:hypothetical protein
LILFVNTNVLCQDLFYSEQQLASSFDTRPKVQENHPFFRNSDLHDAKPKAIVLLNQDDANFLPAINFMFDRPLKTSAVKSALFS